MSKIAKSAVFLMLATIAAKVLGFMRELVLASTYGATMYSDAYLIAIDIPSIIFAVIGASISTTFIPMYFDIKNNNGEENALKFTNNIIHIIVIICSVLAIIGLIFTEQIVRAFAIGFEKETFELTVKFAKILITGIIFTGLSFIMTSYLQVKGNFIIPGIVAVPKNIIIIISIILSTKYGPFSMIWGYLIGMIAEFVFQLPFAIKKGYKYNKYLNIKDEYIVKTIWLIAPVLIGVGVNQINSLIDRSLASTLVEGSISSLNYANKLNNFVTALFITSIASVIYPMLSELSSKANKDRFIDSVVKSVNFVILLVTPISLGAMVLATPIVRLLFERGEFDDRATSMTAIALIMYSLGMVAFGLRDILGRVFYSLQDTKTPMINGAIAMTMNIVLNLILIRYLEIAGLALATSISSIMCILLLFNSLKKKIGYFGTEKIIRTTLKSIISSIIMGLITYFGYDLISNILGNGFIYDAISLFGAVVLGAITYIVLVILLKVEEISFITEMVKKKIVKKVS